MANPQADISNDMKFQISISSVSESGVRACLDPTLVDFSPAVAKDRIDVTGCFRDAEVKLIEAEEHAGRR